MSGRLIGVGVGPGDPELLTIKAIKMIQSCDVIAVPGKEVKETFAYKIASQIVDVSKKRCIAIHMPMTKEQQQLDRFHAAGIEQIVQILEEGKDIAFLTLGDPTVYSTYMYLHKGIREMGYNAEIVNGITSFCAAAARLNISLVEKAEQLHIIPANYQIENAMELQGTKIFMKAGSSMPYLKENLVERDGNIYMVENCGTTEEKLYVGADHMSEKAGYYSLVIWKE